MKTKVAVAFGLMTLTLVIHPAIGQEKGEQKSKTIHPPTVPEYRVTNEENYVKGRSYTTYATITREVVKDIDRKGSKVAQAQLDFLEPYIEANPEDGNLRYAQSYAYLALGELDLAMDCVDAAIANGLPVERVLVGPRDLWEPLRKTPRFQTLIQQNVQRNLLHGPMLGAVTPSQASLWVRTFRETPTAARFSKTPDFTECLTTPVVQTRADRDYTAVVSIQGLEPQTTYYYQLLLDGKPVALDGGVPSFETHPLPGQAGKFSLAFGGGAAHMPINEHMWETLLLRDHKMLLLLGDNVYIDCPDRPPIQRYCYYNRRSQPEFRKASASLPTYAVWDDHDFGGNDCSSSLTLDNPPWKRSVLSVFQENWVNPSYGAEPEHPGVWFSITYGDVEVFMLDCRFYRQNPKLIEEPRSMLGPDQKAWLKTSVANSKATFKILCSSVPWAYATKGSVVAFKAKGLDTWDGFHNEREELFSFFEEKKVNGIVLLSADRHRSDLRVIKRPNGYDLYDFESSRMVNQIHHQLVKGALFAYREKNMYGMLEFDTTLADPEVTLSVININNELGTDEHTGIPCELKLTLSQLTHPK